MSQGALSLQPTSFPTNSKDQQDDSAAKDSCLKSSPYAVAHATLPEWTSIAAMASLIFGGCCANVFALEAIIKEAPGSGTLITFTQFLLTSLFSVKSQLDVSRGWQRMYLKSRAVPLRIWTCYTLMFLTINVLNNQAFKYKISIPLHIIFRSAGPVASMAVGYAAGRRYSRDQVLAVTLLFLGVVQAATADARSKQTSNSIVEPVTTSRAEFAAGVSIISVAMLLSAILGVYTDRAYAQYGRDNWSENLFYSHTISLPFFMLYWPELSTQLRRLLASPATTTYELPGLKSGPPNLFHDLISKIPVQLVLLLTNGLTQYLCIRGVNLLFAQTSSLTVTIVLNVRKLISLLLSIWLFGNHLAPGVMLGAFLVFVGAGIYAMPRDKPAWARMALEEKKRS